jgi:4-amino-4-deoxy-L-arabinose transferase-like glycosyltransferase
MRRIALVLILAAAAAARLWFLTAGVPHAVGIDEAQVVDRAIRILRTGDWNPHVFEYPTLVIYFNAALAIVRFLWGALQGEWRSLDGFSVEAIYTTLRFAAALIGIVTVWITYRLGTELASRGVGLLAAAQLAVRPMHVRESHFVLTDVPMTALTTLAMWMSVRAMRLGSARAYAWAGAACGLAAAAEYNGGLAILAVGAAWLLQERREPDRGRRISAALGAAAGAFLICAPYTILDMPAFLDGFAAQFARFAIPRAPGAGAAWLEYLKHLSLPWLPFWVPLGLAGIGLLLWRPKTRLPAVPVTVFALSYFYVLSSHSHVFGRYTLPLVPVLCVFTSAATIEIVQALTRIPALQRPLWQPCLTAAAVVLLTGPAIDSTVGWVDGLKRPDTRTIAAEWLKANTPKGTRVAVENSGPTYLDAAGFKVAGVELLLDRPIDFYRSRVDYLVISAADTARYGDYLGAGQTVFQVSPTPQRWGPPIQVVRLRSAVPSD